jgi:threonine/homoserine/homoserine lactone efflux protein
MENKFALFMATMLLQLFEPSFDTPLEILSFVMCLVCLIIIASFHVGNIMILRRVRQQRQILKEYLNEIEMSTLAEPEPN